ncbi:MAG: hypothetical protein IKU50_03845 [Bacteroidaceae bacterium]|nr:hypothetical protein [Bacteroidaceae bacterium]
MKKGLNLLLAVTIIGLGYICYRSIMGPIEFAEERSFREKAIIARLIDIRTAQVEYRNITKAGYSDNLDSLIEFVKTAQMPIVLKEGELDDAQLERGLTEKKAMEIIAKAQKTNNWKEVEKEGLKNFRRDTSWIALLDTLYPQGYQIDSLAFVPFGNGTKFEVATSVDTTKAGSPQYLFEVRTPYEVYLSGVNDQELKNLISEMKKMGRYCGLKVGDVEMPNNNAGNWE